MRIKYLALIGVLHSLSSLAETKIRWAKAFDKKNQLIYLEKHTHNFDDAKIRTSITEYLKPDSKRFAVMEGDYSISESLPVCTFRDDRFGSELALRRVSGEYIVVRKQPNKPEETLPLTKITKNFDNLFACQGWHFFLLRNLGRISQEPMHFRLLIPERFDYYSVRITKEKEQASILKLRLEFDSWLLRLLAPTFKLEYDRKKSDIIAFAGVSNISTDDGSSQFVRIEYQEEGPTL